MPNGAHLTYAEQLLSTEWQNCRRRVITRDHHKCSACKNAVVVQDWQMAYSGYFPDRFAWRHTALTVPDHNVTMIFFPQHVVPLIVHPMLFYYTRIDEVKTTLKAVRHLSPHEHDTYFHLKNRQMDAYNRSTTDNYQQRVEHLTTILKSPHPEITFSGTDYDAFNWLFVAELNVHHTFYQEGKMAWEYPLESLLTYCEPCHLALHSTQQVPHLNAQGIEIGRLTPCSRCGGAGEFPEFYHVEEGICFRCGGAKYDELMIGN